MFFAILALVEAGDEVFIPNPSFPIYESMVNFVGGRPVFVPLRQEHEFRFDLDEFRAGLSERTKMVILNSPANPTGGVLTPEDIAALADILRERPDVVVLSDEIYSRMLYETPFASIASEPDLGPAERTIILDGFSKTYAMTGWRLGYGVMPVPLAEHVTKLQVNSNSCTNAATQHAGLEALRGPQDERRRDARRVPRPPGPDRLRPERAPRRRMHHPAGRLLRLSRRSPDTARTPSPTSCSKRPASPASRARPSVATAKATCASPTPTRARTSPGRSTAWARSSPERRTREDTRHLPGL